MRPVLEATNSDTHGWSLGASDGDHNVRLDAMDEGLTRLVASLPSDSVESKGNAVADQGPFTQKQKSLFCAVCVSLLKSSYFPVYMTALHAPVIWWCLSECVVSFWSTGGPCMHFAGKDAVASGKHSLAAKLAASPVWLSLTLDAETFPSTGQQVYATCVLLPLIIPCLDIPCWLTGVETAPQGKFRLVYMPQYACRCQQYAHLCRRRTFL